MKYIDSEKLKAEIERLIKVNKELTPRNFTQGIAAGYADVLSSIESMEQEQPAIKGWVARDKGAKSCCFYFNRPIRHTISWMDERHDGSYNDDYIFLSDIHLDIKDLRWEDEPIEVELTIRKV